MKKTVLFIIALLLAALASCSFSASAPNDEIAAKVAEFCKTVKADLEAEKANIPADVTVPDYYTEGRNLVVECKYDYAFATVPDLEPDFDGFYDDVGWVYASWFKELREFAGSDDVGLILRSIDVNGNRAPDYRIDKDNIPERPAEWDRDDQSQDEEQHEEQTVVFENQLSY